MRFTVEPPTSPPARALAGGCASDWLANPVIEDVDIDIGTDSAVKAGTENKAGAWR